MEEKSMSSIRRSKLCELANKTGAIAAKPIATFSEDE